MEKAKEVHGERYSYNNSVYSGSAAKVCITCQKHGDFHQTASAHMVGKGCPKCASEIVSAMFSKDKEYFLDRARKVHGDRYSYEKVDYTRAKDKVEIVCKDHGSFWQTPDKHAMGRGCSSCSTYGFDTNKPGYVYILVHEDITKVGITNRYLDSRIKEINRSSGRAFYPLTATLIYDGLEAYATESKLLAYLSKYERVDEKFDGSTECFLNVNRDLLLKTLAETLEESTCATY